MGLSADAKAGRFCRRCRGHGVTVAYRYHRKLCPYLYCDCQKCADHEYRRQSAMNAYHKSCERKEKPQPSPEPVDGRASPSRAASSDASACGGEPFRPVQMPFGRFDTQQYGIASLAKIDVARGLLLLNHSVDSAFRPFRASHSFPGSQ